MGIFRKMGRNVEEFARSVKETADENADYRCADCDEPYYTEHETCSECGGDVHPVESSESVVSEARGASGEPTEAGRSADEPDGEAADESSEE